VKVVAASAKTTKATSTIDDKKTMMGINCNDRVQQRLAIGDDNAREQWR
jgi:hypothetical protein